MDTLIAVDGTALLFRAYFGGSSHRAPDGTQVGAVMAVCQKLATLLRTERPTHLAAVFDAGPKTFRNDLCPSYKANRGDPPPDLVPQFDLVLAAAAAMGFPTFCVPGFEADDLMATLAHHANGAGLGIRMLSGDKDLGQLVRDAHPPVVQEDPWSMSVWDEAGIVDRLGVRPDQCVDLQALVGDSTDNVQGVRGVGPKTAIALLQHFGDLDALYSRLDEVAKVEVRGAKALAAKLQAGLDDATLARRLVVLRRDVPLNLPPIGFAAATRNQGPPADADALFARLGFMGPLRTARAAARG